ncbi:phage tail assembly chaperone [Leptospira idonii]|uniref:Phage tail assembly chaperone-like domain-containing protein n=1 Tax=Leptospira idonii TaxID=1193500 RepID=A0A4R9M237_9LEPT|nr:phage tail assembly chaperone [Leptospira idonii]TGN20810.1 hypothetical protein EHS15_01875 [Leptospira idonii]
MQSNTKPAYQFDLNGVFIGRVDAIESPKEPGNFVLPNGAKFLEPPPDIEINECLFHDGSHWIVKPDYSGKPYYHRKSRAVRYFMQGEELDGNYTALQPLENEHFQKFTNTWEIDEEAKSEHRKSIIRNIRNAFLSETDKYLLPDHPMESSIKEKYQEYRRYLRDYTKKDDWHLSEPMTFEKWMG